MYHDQGENYEILIYYNCLKGHWHFDVAMMSTFRLFFTQLSPKPR